MYVSNEIPRSDVAFVEGKRDLVGQVREQRVSRVCKFVVRYAHEDLYLRFTAGVQHMGELPSENYAKT